MKFILAKECKQTCDDSHLMGTVADATPRYLLKKSMCRYPADVFRHPHILLTLLALQSVDEKPWQQGT